MVAAEVEWEMVALGVEAVAEVLALVSQSH